MQTFEEEIIETYRLFPISALMGYAKKAILPKGIQRYGLKVRQIGLSAQQTDLPSARY